MVDRCVCMCVEIFEHDEDGMYTSEEWRSTQEMKENYNYFLMKIWCNRKSNCKLETPENKGSCRQKLLTERAVSMGYLEAWHIQLHSNFPHYPSIHKQLSWGMWIVLLGNRLQKAAHSSQPQVHHQPHINSQTLYTLMWRWGKTDREQYRGLYWLSFSREYHTCLVLTPAW